MESNNNVVAITNEALEEEVTSKLIVTIQGQDYIRDLNFFGLTFDSSEDEIISAVAPAIQEEYDVDITSYYKVRKATNTENVYVIPNSVAG